MGGDYTVLSLNQNDLWNEYLNLLPPEQQDIYYTPNYYSLYQNLGDGLARCFVFQSGDNIALYPFLINSVNELGYELDKNYYDIQGVYGYNGVVASTCNREFIDMFYKAFNSYCADNNIIAEFTRFHPCIQNHIFSQKYSNVIFNRKTVYIDLKQSIDQIINSYKKNTKQEFKRANNKYKMEVGIFKNDLKILDMFVDMYNYSMDRLSAVPYLYFNYKYFRDLMKMNNSFMCMVFYRKKPIAATLNLVHNLYLQGHLACSLTEFRHLNPNSLAYTETLKYGKTVGCKYYNLGGGRTEDSDDTLFKYKNNFSNTTFDYFIGKNIYNKKIYDAVVDQWEKKYPDKVEANKNIHLRYRNIKYGRRLYGT